MENFGYIKNAKINMNIVERILDDEQRPDAKTFADNYTVNDIKKILTNFEEFSYKNLEDNEQKSMDKWIEIMLDRVVDLECEEPRNMVTVRGHTFHRASKKIKLLKTILRNLDET